jgi:hypothetical protein
LIVLTFDTDHMRDSWMEEFLRKVRWPGRATFFVHDRLPALDATGHELCPHPFFEDLSQCAQALREAQGRIPVPSSGIRPHSCAFSHMVGVQLRLARYTYISQAQNLYQTGLRPFRHPWGIWEMPIYYMDNMDFWMANSWPKLGHHPFAPTVISRALGGDGLFVFDFHPLHVALNTRSASDYAEVKHKVLSGERSPFHYRFPGRGTAVFFEELCEAMDREGVRSYACIDALAAWIE